MSDPRRLNTEQVLREGILNIQLPAGCLPDGRQWLQAEDLSDEQRRALLRDEDKALEASNYYGIPHLWKEGEKYRGVLLQYRAISEDESFTNEDEALEWFAEKCAETDG